MTFFEKIKRSLKIPLVLTGYDSELLNDINTVLSNLGESYILNGVDDDKDFSNIVSSDVPPEIVTNYVYLNLVKKYSPPTGLYVKQAMNTEIEELENILKTS